MGRRDQHVTRKSRSVRGAGRLSGSPRRSRTVILHAQSSVYV